MRTIARSSLCHVAPLSQVCRSLVLEYSLSKSPCQQSLCLDGSVKWPARLEISTSPPNATISKFNDTVHLICRATGYPQYNVHWVYDRTGSGKSTQSFREIPTNDLTVEGAGKGEKYRCIGKSSIGDLSIRDVDVYGTVFHTDRV